MFRGDKWDEQIQEIKKRNLGARFLKNKTKRQKLKEDFLIKQDGKCPICLKDLTEYRGHLDHDHITGKYRGLLCHPCNTGIGLLKEDINNLYRAAIYLVSSE